MPYFLINGESIYDKLHQPKFHWLVFSDEQNDYQALKAELKNKHANLVDLNLVPLQSHVAEIFGANKSFHVLLRPDNYLGFISQGASSDEISAYLNKFVGLNKDLAGRRLATPPPNKLSNPTK